MSQSMYSSEERIDFEPIIDFNDNQINYEPIIRVLRLDSHLGINSLAEQYVNRLLKNNSFEFNVMLLGQTDVGKSTLIDTLFRVKFKYITLNLRHNHNIFNQ